MVGVTATIMAGITAVAGIIITAGATIIIDDGKRRWRRTAIAAPQLAQMEPTPLSAVVNRKPRPETDARRPPGERRV
jgi:hypothetical protein